ncbi:MAG: [Fe-Fe] hydrogenase large subunit C-terminal domain-containing protein [Desulfobacterales bacterium]
MRLVVHTLKAAGKLIEAVRSGEASYHFVEVMACPRMRKRRRPAPEQASHQASEQAPGRAVCH